MHPPALSKTKLLTSADCLRKLWLEQRRPDLRAETSAATESLLAAGRVVGELARKLYGRGEGHMVSFEHGVRAALEETRALLARGGTAPIFEATVEHDGLVVRVDVLDRSGGAPRIVEVKSAASVKDWHLVDCAIQAWTLREAGIPITHVAVAHIDTQFVYRGDGDYSGLLAEEDVTASIAEHVATVPQMIEHARAALASTDEPSVAVGPHCGAPFDCAFYAHCAPRQGEYSVWALGGRTERRFALMHEGFADLRDVPEDRLVNDRERRIWQQTKAGVPWIAPELREAVASLGYPRYYLDFETINPAIPLWADTRPYEQVPFQWSCHVDDGAHTLAQRAFLDLSGNVPLRACAQSLVEALGTRGPILTYTPFERGVLSRLAARFPDLAAQLRAIGERLVDLYPIAKQHYYHPAMRGSWSIKDVLPTVAPELSYETLGEVRDGGGAQAAFLEAIDPGTTAGRREQLRAAMLDYCARDTLAMVRLVEYFGRA